MSIMSSAMHLANWLLTANLHHSATNRQQAGSGKHAGRGFTLVELVMVIALAGIVAVMISTVMSRPLQGFVDQGRRAELTDLAATALNRMARDIRLAVPNSLAVSKDEIRIVPIAAAGRYRANQPDPSGPRQDPPICAPLAGPCTIEILSPMEPQKDPGKHWLIIYNTGSLIGLPDPVDGMISPISPKVFTWTGGVLSADLSNFRFALASPQHRFYLANKVVGYRCAAGVLVRAEFPDLAAADYSKAPMVVNHVDCGKSSFTYEPGTNTRNGLVTLKLVLTNEGGTVTLLQQVHVDNAP